MTELRTAECYIFMEFFIVAEGSMWESILEVLKKKVSSGVEVRIIYDDFASMERLPSRYWKHLEKLGIKCIAFNPFLPIASAKLNNRTHRKIIVIDGITAFYGGFNMADEYINLTHPHGVWKDTGVRIKGEASFEAALMFLTLWNGVTTQTENYDKYRPQKTSLTTDGYVQQGKRLRNKLDANHQ